jgi:4-hydroxybenzoate polyprenyltransferase
MQLTAARQTGTTATTRPRPRGRDADGMAVASFVLGLLGLLVLNLFLGPIAVVLAAVALKRGTTRRGRAYLGLGLGIADLVVLAALMQTTNTVSWSF